MRSQSYYLDYQNVRFIALDVNAFANKNFDEGAKKHVQEKELEWLNNILSNNPNRWTIVFQHQPIFSMIKERQYEEMRAALEPLYERYRVDLVLQGHDHIYARSHRLASGSIVNPSSPGVIYVISVSGPKMYKTDNPNRELMAKIIEQKQLFQIIDISPGHLLFTAYAIDGTVVDKFEINKSGNDSTYVDEAPEK